MSEVRERYYALTRYRDGIVHESMPFDSYDRAYQSGVEELTRNPRNIRAEPAYFTVERRYEATG